MANDALYQELAKALARPSGAYRAASEALNIPKQAVEGYKYGADLSDSIRKRKLEQQTLQEALGGQMPEGTEGFGNTTVEGAGILSKPIEAIAALVKARREPKETGLGYTQGAFKYTDPKSGKELLTRFNKNGGYDALTDQGWVSIGPSSQPGGASISTGGTTVPRVPPTVPVSETDFLGKADTLKSIFSDIQQSFRPEYVGPVAGPVGRAVDVYTPFGNEARSHFRNQVSKAFNNLIYLRSGKQINEDESNRMAEEFIKTNNSPIAFKSALDSMQSEMNSLVANKRKQLSQSGYRLGGQSEQPTFGSAKTPTFNTEQEAEASGYKGPAMIGGKRAVIH